MTATGSPWSNKTAMIRFLAILALALLASACQPFSEPASMLDTYVERVARVLDVNHELRDVPPVALFPRRRTRRLEVPELDMDMLDFLSLHRCRLQEVVGERNSGLGRVMQPVNVLRYDVRFIRAAADCLPKLGDDPALASQVRQARNAKIDGLSISTWNAIWGTEAIEPLFTRTRGPLPIQPDREETRRLVGHLERLHQQLDRLASGQWQVDLTFLGEMQQQWQNSHRLGQLFLSARLLTTRLNEAADLVEQRLSGAPLCLNKKTNPQADIVRKMFFSVYAEKVQSYMATVDRNRRQLLPPVRRLAERHETVMPHSLRPYVARYLAESGSDSLWQSLDRATTRHTQVWQELLAQCGMRPGG
ncbi:hypothetical protein C8D92_11212 [Tamilnaduibacter salinus]|uniref:DUF3080 family protein n=1 Tax=Tamilnaduibacter salinus TaxID=1484056 RepID=A0A2U1CT29_9GAMM|nr:DUF3080 domain-containing protein [Tamilnaduibacter salinus]PVY69610.1 hypothetical protein C8D92_11212 [Tamilnaduibacter salinus]